MDRVSQYSDRDINNVEGNQYILNDPVFKAIEGGEVGGFILERTLKVDYFDELKSTFTSKKLISRKAVSDDIEEHLKLGTSLLLYGEPGIGKTTIIRDILFGNKKIYISLRDREVDEVFTYLIEIYGLQFDKEQDLGSMLEGLMRTSEYIFIFDDCESNTNLVQKLERLEKFENKFLYLSRKKNIFKAVNINKYELMSLTKVEVKEFVNFNMMSLEDDKIDELHKKSKGNPLYLYYYVNYRIDPLPTGLENYQETLWENINSEGKEILSCIAITNFPIKREVINHSFNKIIAANTTLMEFQVKISSIDYLLENNKGKYRIFHPLFKEYILKYITNYDMKSEYETIVGETAIEKNDIIEGTLLLLDKDSNMSDEYLLEVGISLYNFSRIALALDVLEKALLIYKKDKKYEEYYAHSNYHISQLYMDINKKESGYKCIDEAIELYKELNIEEGLFLCIVFKATFLADEGRKVETEKLIKKINEFETNDEKLKSYLYINMSKINLVFNQYESAAINSKKAYELFKKLDNKEGAVKSLLNYSGALANIDQEELATEYLESVLESDNLIINKNIKAALMNNLTSCYRKSKKYSKAIEICNESIKICKELGQFNRVVMNLLNLGNVYRDLKEWEKCESVYFEGIKIAEQQGVIREVGRGNELLAICSYKQGKFKECIKYSEIAVASSKEVNDDFRVAEAYIEMSKAYNELGQSNPYINCIEEAIKYYIKENFFDEALLNIFEAIKYYCNDYNEIKVNEHLNKINDLLNSSIDVDYASIHYNLKECFDGIHNKSIVNIYYNIIKAYINSDMSVNLLGLVISFTGSCKKNKSEQTKILFMDVVNTLIYNGKESVTAMNILAFIIEQSGELIELRDIEIIIKKIEEYHDDIYIRTVRDETYVFTNCFENEIYLQYVCEFSQLINIKISLAIYLIFNFNEGKIMQNVDEVKYKDIDFNILSYHDVKSALGDNKFLKEIDLREMPIIITSGVASEVSTFIIIEKDYDIKADNTINKDNRIFIYSIMRLFIEVIKRVKGISIKDADYIYAKKAREFIEYLTYVEDNNSTSKWIVESLVENS